MSNNDRPWDADECTTSGCRPISKGLRLQEDVVVQLRDVMPTRRSIDVAEQCLQQLRLMLSRLAPDWDAQAFGSYANGFGTRFSDLDVTCCQPGNALAQDSRRVSLTLGEQILPFVRAHPRFTVVEEILNARIPIVKLCFDKALDVDLSCHNPTPLLNTRLLKAYSALDPRIRDLGIAIKLWAKGAGLCDATKSNLSSYSFTLLVLYFMQVHADVQLPVLSTEEIAAFPEQEAFERAMVAASTWCCTLSLPELMSRFFAFYSNSDSYGFSWGTEVVSVRCGSRRAISDSVFAKLRGKHARRIHIEDPYQTERNLHAPLGEIEEEQLRTAFREASCSMQVKLAQAVPPSCHTVGRLAPGMQPATSQAIPAAYSEESSSDLAELIRVYKAGTATDSGTDSTRSARTVPAVFSDTDDESSAKSSSSCGPNAATIPLPSSLLKRSDASFP